MPTTPIPRGHVACPCCGEPTPVLRWANLRESWLADKLPAKIRGWMPRMSVTGPPYWIVSCSACGGPVNSMWICTPIFLIGMGIAVIACAARGWSVDLVTVAVLLGTCWGGFHAVRLVPSRYLAQKPKDLQLMQRIRDRDQHLPVHTREQFELFCSYADRPRLTRWLDAHIPKPAS